MQIDGPLTVGVVDNQETMSRELHIGFKPEFSSLELPQRIESISAYLCGLQAATQQSSDDAAVQGILLLSQVVEELLPHLQEDEIPLHETIVIEIKTQNTLSDLIQDSLV